MPFLFMHDENTRIPAGTIIMWSGLKADIPAGWAFCDGTNGTPDLRNKFIVGGKEDSGGVVKTDVAGYLQSSGGEIGHFHYIGDTLGHDHGTDDNTISVSSGQDNVAQQGNSMVDNETLYLDCWYTETLPPFFALAYIMKL